MAQEDLSNGAPVTKSVTFSALKPELFVEAQKVGDAVTFYKSVFGAVESGHSLYPKRKLDQELPHVLSAELELAGVTIVVLDASSNSDSTEKNEGKITTLRLETDDVLAAVEKSVAAGAVKVGEVTEVETEGGGQLKGKVTDPFGITWTFVSPAKKIENAENSENLEAKEV